MKFIPMFITNSSSVSRVMWVALEEDIPNLEGLLQILKREAQAGLCDSSSYDYEETLEKLSKKIEEMQMFCHDYSDQFVDREKHGSGHYG